MDSVKKPPRQAPAFLDVAFLQTVKARFLRITVFGSNHVNGYVAAAEVAPLPEEGKGAHEPRPWLRPHSATGAAARTRARSARKCGPTRPNSWRCAPANFRTTAVPRAVKCTCT